MRFDTIRYSVVWEDWLCLQQGLQIEDGDDVLSVTSAGDNVLALLLQNPRSVTAVDMNPAQTAFLELKLAGIRSLSHQQFAGLIGVRPHGDRIALYEKARPHLSTVSRSFWDENTSLLIDGACRCGRLERYISRFPGEVMASLVAPDVVGRLLNAETLAEQRAIYENELATPDFVAAFETYFGRENMAKNGRDPAQFRHVEEGNVGRYFYKRFRYACTELPLAGNFYVELFLTSRYNNLEAGPEYLRPGNFARLKQLVDRVEPVTGELEEIIRAAKPGRFNKANFSDVFEYMSQPLADALFEAMASSFRAGGRLCYWNLLVPRHRPAPLEGRIERLSELSDSLWRQDRSWFYRAFHVEEFV